MSRSRLSTALDGGFPLPDGPILALRPPADADLSALPRDRVMVTTTNRADRDAWEAGGYAIADDPAPAAVAYVCIPRSKALARGLVAQAAALAPLVVVDGRRTEGIDSIWRDVQARRPEAGLVAQGHGRLFWFEGGEGFGDWSAPGPVRGADGLFAQPGVFSEGGLDRGSALLGRALPARLPARMADFGAGVGALSLAILAREGVQSLDLVEVERLALDCARLNVVDPRARFLWADALRLGAADWDGIVMNPPFHGGTRAADPGLGAAFIAAGARHLAPGGQLWLVANRHLPYEEALSHGFRDVAEIGGDGSFKLIHATAGRARGRPASRAPSRADPRPRERRRHPAG